MKFNLYFITLFVIFINITNGLFISSMILKNIKNFIQNQKTSKSISEQLEKYFNSNKPNIISNISAEKFITSKEKIIKDENKNFYTDIEFFIDPSQ